MGCIHSSKVSTEGGLDLQSQSSSPDNMNTPNQTRGGRVGITPVSISSCSSSSDEDGPTNPYQLVEQLVVGIHEISSDSDTSSEASLVVNNIASGSFASPDVTANQSIDDIGENESVVDWLLESSGTTLFTSTSGGEGDLQRGYKLISAQHEYTLNAKEQGNNQFNQAETVNEHEETNLVKDTKHVERKHVPLPSSAPSATKGNWLTSRYVVNDYIILSEIGKGAHSEVRLCKHKENSSLFAVKIMNRKLLKSKVDIQNEIGIMKSLKHPSILRLYEVLDDPKGR